MAHLFWTKFSWYKPLLLLLSTSWHFSFCKILKNSCSGSRVMRMCHFWAQNGPFAPNKFFFESYWYHSHLPISPSIVQNLKKFFPADPELWGYAIFGTKWPISPNENFLENLLMSLVSFIHTFLHPKNQSQILIY